MCEPNAFHALQEMYKFCWWGFWFPDVNSVFQYKAAVKFKNSCSLPWSQDSIVSVEIRPQAGDQKIVWFPATARDVSLLPNTQISFWGPSLLNTVNTTSRVAEAWSWPHKHHLVLKRMREALSLPCHMPSCYAEGQIFFYKVTFHESKSKSTCFGLLVMKFDIIVTVT
jgi:hypothetical protein